MNKSAMGLSPILKYPAHLLSYSDSRSCCIAPFSQKGHENYTLGDAAGVFAGNLKWIRLSELPHDLAVRYAAESLRKLRAASAYGAGATREVEDDNPRRAAAATPPSWPKGKRAS